MGFDDALLANKKRLKQPSDWSTKVPSLETEGGREYRALLSYLSGKVNRWLGEVDRRSGRSAAPPRNESLKVQS